MQLLVVRHAIAVERGTPPYEDDAERPLTPKGVRRMRRAADGIARLLPRVAAIYTSPLVRAAETAELLAEAWGGAPRPVVADVLAPRHSAATAVRWLRAQGVDTATAVGHEPGCSDLVSYLLTGSTALAFDFKKGGAALVDVAPEGMKPRGTLLWFAPPRLLRSAR